MTCQPHVLAGVIIIKPKGSLPQVPVSVLREVKMAGCGLTVDNVCESSLEFPGKGRGILLSYCFLDLWLILVHASPIPLSILQLYILLAPGTGVFSIVELCSASLCSISWDPLSTDSNPPSVLETHCK